MNMLIYVNDRVYVMIFGVLVAVGAKWVLRARARQAPALHEPVQLWDSRDPYPVPVGEHRAAVRVHRARRHHGRLDRPGLVLIGGTMLNAKLTGRMWLIAGWLSVYVVQAVFRGLVLDTSIPAALIMMTGVAFVLYTNYMVTDPGTSPSAPGSQFAFGGGIAVVYGFFTGAGIAYGLFFATAVVCAIRGGFLWALYISDKARAQRAVLDGARSGDATAGTADPTDSAGKKVVTA